MALPEKEFYTLDEIIDRWRFAGCDRATLLDYAGRDLLVFSIYLRDLGTHKVVEETETMRITRTSTTMFSFRSSDSKWTSIRYLKAEDARRILEGQENESVGVSVLYSESSRTMESSMGYPQAQYFKPTDLLVTRSERDRFEKAHGVNLASGTIGRAWSWISDTTNQKALGYIGGVLAAIAVAAWQVYAWFHPRGG
jgi:hypothetical protein